MTNPNLPPSDEGLEHIHTEAIIVGEDWDLRFSANAAASRALKAEIEAETDPVKKAELIAMKHESVIRRLGSGALSLFKRDLISERESFEAEFGDQQ